MAGPLVLPDPSQTANPSAPRQDNPALIESQIQQLTSASLSGYGMLPNPQAVTEAVSSGGTPTLSNALQEGNPLYQAILAGTPAGGQAGPVPYGSVPTQIQDPSQSLHQFDPASYQQSIKGTLGQDQNASWRSFGMAPTLNFGWMDWVRHGSADTVRKWQQLLKDRGYLDHTYQVSGVWDKPTEAMFQGFMIQWATPQALFAQDPQQRSNATMFLNGLGFDVSTWSQQNIRDPSTLAQVAQNWMAAQGPDVGTDQKSELQKYADQFGTSALPQSYQAIIQNNFFQTVRDGLSSLFGLGDIAGHIPIVGGVFHGAVNALTGNFDFSHMADDPRVVRAQQIQHDMQSIDKLSDNDIKNLKPALDAVQDDAGFLGFMDDYDHARSKFVLASVYTLGDLVTGKYDSQKDNPFDPMSGVNLTAQAHQDNLFAGLFGDQAAQDNPGWAGLFNFAANVADDPTSYIPLVGQLEVIQKARGIRTVARAIGNDEARSAFSNLMGQTIKERTNDGFFKAARTLVQQQGHWGLADVAQMFSISGGGDHGRAALTLAEKIVDPATSEDVARRLFLEGDETHPGFGHRINSGRSLYNAHAAWSSLAQVKSTRILGKARVVGAFEEHPEHFGLSDPAATSQFFRNVAIAIGMKPEQLRPALEAYTKASLHEPNKVLHSMQGVEDAILNHWFQVKGVKQDEFRSWVGRLRAGRSFSKVGGMSLDDRINMFAPDPVTGAETSLAVKGEDPAMLRQAQARLRQLQQNLTLATETGAAPEDLQRLRDEMAALQRPAPALTTQLADQYHFPYSIYEMVAYQNPVLRRSEQMQSFLHADAVMNTWKRITIGRISSALRIDLGDDIIRPFTQLIGQGHFVAAFSYLMQSTLRAFGLLIPGVGLGEASEGASALRRATAKVPRLRGDKGVRGYVLRDLDRMLERNPEAQRVLQTQAKIMGETDTRMFIGIPPKDVGYGKALELALRNHFAVDPLSQAWLKGFSKDDPLAARKALTDFVKNSDDPKVRALIEAQHGDLDAGSLNALMDRYHDWLGAYFRNDTLRQMASSGKFNSRQLQTLVRDHANRPDSGLPITFGRNQNAYARNMMQRWATRVPDAVFEHITKPMIDQARVRGFIRMKAMFATQVRRYFRDRPGRSGPEFDALVDNESTSLALDWIQNNTYQGTRSVMGGTVRNIFPFYGATVNMDRFYMRQAMATPFVGSLIDHAALASQQSQNAAHQGSPGLSGLEGVLGHLGFGAGEGMQFNPMAAFFLTSDGIGSMVPGTGPIFAPLWNLASGNPTFAQILADVIPGAQSQIDFNTGQARPMFPWLADLISGTSLALTGGAPNLGPLTATQESVDRLTDEKVQQRERQEGRAVGSDELQSIRQEVGRDLMLQGAASFTLPVQPRVTDLQAQGTQQNLDQWRQATDDTQKDAVLAQAFGITPQQWQASLTGQPGAPPVSQLVQQNPQNDAALMAYMDRRVTPEERDAIASYAPWVVSGSTSKYVTATSDPNSPQTPVDLAHWQMMRRYGDISLRTPDAFLGQIHTERDINSGWLEYDALKNLEYETLVRNGWSAQDPQFTAWKAAVLNPQIIAIQNNHPQWWKMFGGNSSGQAAPELAGKTRSLRTLQTWEAIPQHSDYENSVSVLWRNALQLRDQAAAQIYAINAGHGSQAERDMVMQALQLQLQSLAQEDPGFAAQLNTFRFGSWMDVVNLEAQEEAANQYTGPVA